MFCAFALTITFKVDYHFHYESGSILKQYKVSFMYCPKFSIGKDVIEFNLCLKKHFLTFFPLHIHMRINFFVLKKINMVAKSFYEKHFCSLGEYSNQITRCFCPGKLYLKDILFLPFIFLNAKINNPNTSLDISELKLVGLH